MPKIKSAVKRARQSIRLRQTNRNIKTLLLSSKRKFMAAVEAKEKDKLMDLFRAYCSVLDKAAKKDIIKDNNASRKKHRAALWLAKVK